MDSYECNVKQKSRVKFRKFIKSSGIDLSKARVLCLPGKECLEIKDVYDKLGIPRENIECLEYDSNNLRLLKTNNLSSGTSIKNVKFDGDFKSNDFDSEPYDIISLDFTGRVGGQIDNLVQFFQRSHLIAKETLVLTNFIGNREQLYDKKIYEYSQQIKKQTYDVLGLGHIEPPTTASPRDDLAYGIYWSLFGHREPKVARLLPYGDLKSYFISHVLFMLNKNGIKISFSEEKIQKAGDFVFKNLAHVASHSRTLRRHEAYKYISNNGAPMHLDLWHLTADIFYRQPSLKNLFGRCHLRRCRDSVLDSDNILDYVDWSLVSMTNQDRIDLLNLFCKDSPRLPPIDFVLSNRIDLGKESEHPNKKPKLTDLEKKDLIRLELTKGASVSSSELALKYGVSVGTIAAIKAHVTMGSYQ